MSVNPFAKLAIGACATAMIAFGNHAATSEHYISKLKIQADLAVGGIAQIEGIEAPVTVSFTDSGALSRTAVLSGTVTPDQEAAIVAAVSHIRGVAGAKWVGETLPETGIAIASAAAKSAPTKASPPQARIKAARATNTVSSMPEQKKLAKAAAQPATLATTPRVPSTCQAALNDAMNGRAIAFRSGSAYLNANSMSIIDDVAAAIKGCNSQRILISGHTDKSGAEAINRTMSQERADRVRLALIDIGIDANLLQARGMGAERPLDGHRPQDPANRRIEFTVSATNALATATR